MDRNKEFKRSAVNKRRKLHHQQQPYDRAETSEEEGTPMGLSEEEEEEDDDLPPPVVHHRLKLKHPHPLKEEATPVDLAVPVPRKLRTAMTKRYRESPPHSNNPNKQKHPTNLNQTSFSASLKSSKKTKSGNHSKPRPAKIGKISPSKQEVEVAETLYDLARMFVNQEKPTMPTKEAEAERKLELEHEVKVEQTISTSLSPVSAGPSPQSSEHAPSPGLQPSVTAASSPSSTQTPLNVEAGGLKKTHNSRVKVHTKPVASAAASPCLSTSSLGVTTELADAEQVQQTESAKSTSDTPLVTPEVALTTGSPCSTTDVSASCFPTKQPQMIENISVVINGKQPRVEARGHAQAEDTSTKVSVTVADNICNVIGNSVLKEPVTTVENGEMLKRSPSTEGARTMKFEIDLMASPEPSDCKIDERTNFGMGDEKKKDELKLLDVAAVTENDFSNKDKGKNEVEAKSKDTKFYNEAKQLIEKVGCDQYKDWDLEKDSEEVREACQTKDFLREREMQDVEKQLTERGKNIAEDSKPQKGDGSDSIFIPPMTTVTERCVTSIPLPISLDVTSWPTGIPSLRYHSLPGGTDVATSCTTSLSVSTAPTIAVKTEVAPVLLAQSSKMLSFRKHCTMHVYITHFIDFQRQAKENPLWHSASINSASLYGTWGYNSNGSVAPSGVICGNKKENDLIGASTSDTHGVGTGTTKVAIDFIKERGLGQPVSAAADAQGRMEIQSISHIHALEEKTTSQQHVQTVQQKNASSCRIGLSFGFPTTQSATASAVMVATSGDNIGMSSSMSTGGSPIPSNSLSVASGIGLSTGSVPNAASVQTQYLHPIVQQPAFPISFPPGQVAPTFGGHLPSQQAAQYFGNHFYNAHLVQRPPHLQQSQQVANVTPGTSDPLNQQNQHFQSVCSFASLGSPQQLTWPPSHGDQSLIMGGLQQPQQLKGKGTTEVESSTTGEIKLSTAQGNIYCQNLHSMQVSSLNSSSHILPPSMSALSMRPQDFSIMTAVGGKQTGNMQQKTEMHVQPHYHSVSQLQQQHQQQPNVATQLHVMSPLQMSLKDVESHTSQSLSAMTINRGTPSSAGVLGLPAVTSVMPPQGHTIFHGIGSQNQISVLGQSVSSQAQHQQQQCQSQKHPTQMPILVSRGFEDGKANTSEGNYHHDKGGRLDDKKVQVKHQINSPYLETLNYIQGSPPNRTYSLTSICSSPQNQLVTSTEDGTSVSASIQHHGHSSKKQMARSKASSNSKISSPVESTMITFSDRSPVHTGNFANASSMQGFPFLGQNIDAQNQCISPGYSQQSGQMKVVAWPTTSGNPSQGMLAAMARSHGQLPKSEQSGLDTIPTSRASPALSASSFSGTTLPASPVSKSGAASVSKNSSAKDSYSHSHLHKSSSAATSEKKTSPVISSNMASVLGSSPLSQNLSTKSLQAQMVQNQPQMQKKQPNKQHQRKQQQMSQTLPQQSVQYMVSMQQQPQHCHSQPSPSNQQQAHLLQTHASTQIASQSQQLVDIQGQPLKHLQHQQLQIQQPLLRQQNPQLGLTSSQNQQLEKMHQQNLKYLQQQPQIFSTPFGIVTNGVLTSTLGTNVGTSTRSYVSDGAGISQSSTLRPSTPVNFTVTTNAPSTSQRSSVSGSVIQNNEDGPTRSGLLNQQQILPKFSNPGTQ